MWPIAAGIIVAGSPLVLGEMTVRLLSLKQEIARKLVHVLGAAASASLALFLPLHDVVVLGLLFFGVLAVVRKYKLVRALYDVTRQSYGELLFPVGVSAAALAAQTPKVYVAVMLVVGLADTAASIAGLRFGRHRLRGARAKSLEGSAAFFLTAAVILVIVCGHVWYVLGVSLALTAVEAYSDMGFDNLTVPLLGAILLNTFA